MHITRPAGRHCIPAKNLKNQPKSYITERITKMKNYNKISTIITNLRSAAEAHSENTGAVYPALYSIKIPDKPGCTVSCRLEMPKNKLVLCPDEVWTLTLDRRSVCRFRVSEADIPDNVITAAFSACLIQLSEREAMVNAILEQDKKEEEAELDAMQAEEVFTAA